MQNILILQHEPHEGLGALEPLFAADGRKVKTHHLYSGDSVPLEEELCVWDGIVILGGAMSANDDKKFSFIRDELALVPQAVKLKIPLLGICLGSQIIAKALGAKVYRGAQKEIGWYPLTLTESASKDAIFGSLGFQTLMFQWHGETFDLPSGAIRLASSKLYPNQAFRYTDRIYGLQFHCEMTDTMIREWMEKGSKEIEEAGLSAEKILEETPKYLPHLRRFAHQMAQRWLKLR